VFWDSCLVVSLGAGDPRAASFATIDAQHLDRDLSCRRDWIAVISKWHGRAAVGKVNTEFSTRNLPLALECSAFVLDGEWFWAAGLRRAVVGLLYGPRAALIAWGRLISTPRPMNP
jgi:hypothetical protein